MTLVFIHKLVKIIRIAGMFFASTMVMVTIALVMAVIVTNIYAKRESPERVPNWCVAVVSRFYPVYFRALDETESRSTSPNKKTKSKSSTSTCNDPPPSSEKAPTRKWVSPTPAVVVETGNEIIQLADDTGHRDDPSLDRDAMNEGSGYPSGHNVPEVNKPEISDATIDLKRPLNKHDRRRMELEWKLVAKFTDRVFFWIFLTLSIVVQSALFLQLVPSSSRR